MTITDALHLEEGNLQHLYLDSNGNVSVGVGRLLRDPSDCLVLPWVKASNPQSPAAMGDILSDWKAVKAMKPGLPAAAYARACACRLKQETVDILFMQDLGSVTKQLQAIFQEWGGFPQTAKFGLVDIAYNLGCLRMQEEFPRLVTAAKQKDWKTCSIECIRKPPVSETRNQRTQQWFQMAAA